MTALEIAQMLNITEAEAVDLIEACDEFDREMQLIYPDHVDDLGYEDLVAEGEWDFELEEDE